MGLFNFGKKKKEEEESAEGQGVQRELFVEDTEPNGKDNGNPFQAPDMTSMDNGSGIYKVYAFLGQDFEEKGYNDALTNSDLTYMKDNLDMLRYDLERVIEEALTRYQDTLREIEYHISSRSRIGLIDVVEELNQKKETINDHLERIDAIKDGLSAQEGTTVRVFLSYKRGFTRGLSAITYHKLLN